MPNPSAPFTDPAAVSSYAQGPARNVPGWSDMLRMADLLLAEGVPADGLARYAAFMASSGVDPARTQAAAEAVGSRLTILSPDEDEAMLRDAGFTGVQLFYAGFAFRGWVAYA